MSLSWTYDFHTTPIDTKISIGSSSIAGAVSVSDALFASMSSVRQPKTGQHGAREADAEFLQRAAPRDGLSHALGQFIEFVVSLPRFVGCCLMDSRV